LKVRSRQASPGARSLLRSNGVNNLPSFTAAPIKGPVHGGPVGSQTFGLSNVLYPCTFFFSHWNQTDNKASCFITLNYIKYFI
jgi:hypothetical protein